MQNTSRSFGLFAVGSLALAFSLGFATNNLAKKYQVTGKVTDLSDAAIVVQTTKGDERWEISRDADSKVEGDLKVGSKVTIEYKMVARSIEVKADK